MRFVVIMAARESVLAEGLRGGANSAAVETLFQLLSDHHIGEAIGAALAKSARLKPLLADPEGAKARLRLLVGAGSETSADLIAAVTADTLLTPATLRDIVAALGGDPLGNSRCVDLLARLDPDRIEAGLLRAAFFTGKGEPRSRLMVKKEQADHPATRRLGLTG